MPDQETIHQRRPGPKGTLRFVGKVNGQPYDVIVSVEGKTVEWFDNENVDEVLAPSRPATKKSKDDGCGGCVGTIIKFAKGGWGQMKAKLGLDAAGPELIARRTEICETCPSGMYRFGICDPERGGCDCVLDAKVRIKDQSCPEGHW